MRVIAGKCRSMPLKAPKGYNTRPTTDKTKETLFNVLQPHTEGSVFVDLFAGSGAIGIEALSRGAKKAYFIEHDREALGCIRDNLAFTRLTDNSVVLGCDVCAGLLQIHEKKVDIIFMDPPYRQNLDRKVLEFLAGMSCVNEDTIIICEASLETDFNFLEDTGFECFKEKRYKSSKHLFVRKKAQS